MRKKRKKNEGNNIFLSFVIVGEIKRTMLSKRNYILRGISFAFFYWRFVLERVYFVLKKLRCCRCCRRRCLRSRPSVGCCRCCHRRCSRSRSCNWFCCFCRCLWSQFSNRCCRTFILSYIFLAMVLFRRNSRLLVIKHGLGV